MYNYSTIDFIIKILVEDIETHLNKKDYKYGYLLNKHMNFEIEGIQMNVYIHKKISSNNKYYYDLSSKNFRYYNNEINELEEFDLFTSPYFDNILELLENIKDVKMNYIFFDNILCSPKQKEKLRKLKKSLSFFPKDENECSICYEPTKQVTICNHPICLQCRDKCIQLQKNNCPVCRNSNLCIYPSPDPLFSL